jgi:primosomal protein N' (replication factor Y)
VVDVLVPLPRHADLAGRLTYAAPQALAVGSLVRVPLGRRTVTGVVWVCRTAPDMTAAESAADATEGATDALAATAIGPSPAQSQRAATLRAIDSVFDALPPLGPDWCRLLEFSASYYQRELGELALSVLPPELRQVDAVQLARRLKRLHQRTPARAAVTPAAVLTAPATEPVARPALSDEQSAVLAALQADLPGVDLAAVAARTGEALHAAFMSGAQSDPGAVRDTRVAAPRTTLLHGVTGSGKTEVYLRLSEQVLAAGRQALLLVPEINLTPQLEQRLQARFPDRNVVALHSGLTPAQRLQNWLSAHLGLADLVLGTRMAVFASLPRLGLIVVDEEHDPSYKQQEGARYSARDLAVYRGRQERVPVLLGSATPSLESWFNAQGDASSTAGRNGPAGAPVSVPDPVPAPGPATPGPMSTKTTSTSAGSSGRYRLLSMPQRIGAGALPEVRLLDLVDLQARLGKQAVRDSLLPAPLVQALRARFEAGEQSLVLLNRRGYAPVLHCTSCGWKSACSACSAWRVFHKSDRSLRCHHCGVVDAVPRACPACGDPDIQPMGRGTERIEEQLADLLPGARIARIDADTTRAAGSLVSQLAAAHAGEVDVLVGTQMLAKGHDFRRVTLVAVLNADAALFSADFRAPERLFALLMQAGGRAGRDAAQAARSEVWVPSWHVGHALYTALRRHDYQAFAASQLAERRSAGLPPYSHLALLRAEARSDTQAMAFLDAAAARAQELAGELGTDVLIYPPVPAPLRRVANVERVQMLVEADRRSHLQHFLRHWCGELGALSTGAQRVLRWAVDVDPASI